MSVEDQLEILPDQPGDIGGRIISDTNLPHFKGLPAQTVYNKDDSYRPYIMDGETFGGKPLMFKDDVVINDGKFVTLDYETSLDQTSVLTLDVNSACQFQINLKSSTTTLKFADYQHTETTACKKLNIYLKFTRGNQMVFFPDNFFWEDNIGLHQLDAAQVLSQNKAGDMAAFECFTLDSGALWFGRLIGYWSK